MVPEERRTQLDVCSPRREPFNDRVRFVFGAPMCPFGSVPLSQLPARDNFAADVWDGQQARNLPEDRELTSGHPLPSLAMWDRNCCVCHRHSNADVSMRENYSADTAF